MSSYSQYLPAKAIQTGCEWRLKIKIVSSAIAAFSVGAAFTAHIRDTIDGPEKAVLSTASGTITRIDGNTLEFVIGQAVTADWSEGSVIMDVIRTDLTAKIHLGFDLVIPVKRSITRL